MKKAFCSSGAKLRARAIARLLPFRYDPASQQYVYNLSTKGWTAGNYQIAVVLDEAPKDGEIVVSGMIATVDRRVNKQGEPWAISPNKAKRGGLAPRWRPLRGATYSFGPPLGSP